MRLATWRDWPPSSVCSCLWYLASFVDRLGEASDTEKQRTKMLRCLWCTCRAAPAQSLDIEASTRRYRKQAKAPVLRTLPTLKEKSLSQPSDAHASRPSCSSCHPPVAEAWPLTKETRAGSVNPPASARLRPSFGHIMPHRTGFIGDSI